MLLHANILRKPYGVQIPDLFPPHRKVMHLTSCGYAHNLL